MSIKNPDDKWLEGLAGAATNEEADRAENHAPAALRRAMQDRVAKRPVHTPSEAGFQKLLARAKQDGLLTSKVSDLGTILSRRLLQLLGLTSSDGSVPQQPSIASLAIGYPFLGSEASPTHSLRGRTANEITLRVSDPKQVAQRWQNQLTSLGIDHATIILNDSLILIHFIRGQAAEDLLIEHDIPPPPGDFFSLIIEATGNSPEMSQDR